MRPLGLALLCVGVAFCIGKGVRAQEASEAKVSPCRMRDCSESLMRVVFEPKRFEGKRVVVIGVLSGGYEREGLYATDWHWRVHDKASGVRISLRKGSVAESLSGRAAIVEGTFSGAGSGKWAGVVGDAEVLMLVDDIGK